MKYIYLIILLVLITLPILNAKVLYDNPKLPKVKAPVISGNFTLNQTLTDSLYLLLDGSNANQDIDIGIYDLKTIGNIKGVDINGSTLNLYRGSGIGVKLRGISGGYANTLSLGASGGNRVLNVSGNSKINQDVSTTSSPVFNMPYVTSIWYNNVNQDYKYVSRAGYYFGLQGQSSGIQSSYEYFNKDGDGTDNLNFILWAEGTPDSINPGSLMQFGYITNANPALRYYKLATQPIGEGGDYPLKLYVGANSGMELLANGDVLFPDIYSDSVGGTNRDLFIDDTGKIGYVSSSIDYKKNIRNLTEVSEIYNLNPVIYDRIDGSSKDEIGLIAEEVLNVYPELVSYKQIPIYDYRDSGIKDNNNKTIMELYIKEWIKTNEPETVSYSKLVVPLLTEVQNLKQENQLLKDCIINSKDFITLQECVK